MKIIRFCLIASLLAFLISSCSKSNVPPPTPLDKFPPRDVTVHVKWRTKTGNGNGGLANYQVAPVFKNDTVFVPNQNGQIFALGITNGKVIWQKNVDMNISAQPNTIANALVFGSIKGDLEALEIQTGETLWHTTMPSSLFAQPTIYDSVIYTHTHDGSVASFDAKDGSKNWSVSNNVPEISLPGNSSPIVLNNTVMIGSEFGTVLGFTVDEGDRTINIPIAIAHGSSPADKMVDINANPMLYGDYLIFATYQGAIVALDKDNGKMLWAKKSSIINNMVINDNVIFSTQADSLLKAFDIENGKTIWTNDTLKWRKLTEPVYYKGLIVVSDYQGYLHFFNSLNGEYLGRYKLTPKSKIFNHGISAKLVPTEKGIIIQSDNGNAYLVDAYSDKVIYDTILGDYKVDRGSEIKHINQAKEFISKNPIPVTKDKVKRLKKATIVIGDFTKDDK
ncbi:outer membrane protein assembly factor BamB [Francisella sp. Scap27]|uniref:outer membrane protein assembly factor BamB n=1 Tax=Francisella sp. Scap27 TaxID=2589986 RepID=UPI0015B83502|nr:outer membrane protein assembly factor BamB [Francisella sp. Scap27]QLE78857.1 outer membrane protein assembly factor BamB [Francisella sp. Scap27]